jgi:hypothetical protein
MDEQLQYKLYCALHTKSRQSAECEPQNQVNYREKSQKTTERKKRTSAMGKI